MDSHRFFQSMEPNPCTSWTLDTVLFSGDDDSSQRMDPTSLKFYSRYKMTAKKEDQQPPTMPVPEIPPEMLYKIMENLTPVQLFQLRRVNSTWRAVATSVHLLRQDFQLTLDLHRPHTNRRLMDLNSKFKQYKKQDTFSPLPCDRLVMTMADLAGEEIQNFFTVFGSHLKYMTLASCYSHRDEDDGHFSALAKILDGQTPNLEFLQIDAYHENRVVGRPLEFPLKYNKLFPQDDVELLNLKTFKFSGSQFSKLMGVDILKAAKNLNEFDTFGLSSQVTLDDVVSTNRLATIKTAVINMSPANIGAYEKFGEGGPKLKIMSLATLVGGGAQFLHRCDAALGKILESSKFTLRSLSDFATGGTWSLTQLEMPMCPNLREFSFYLPRKGAPVKGWVEKYSKLFPALKKLVILDVSNFSQVCTDVFTYWKNLQELELLYIEILSKPHLHIELASAMTGFSWETCLQIATAMGEGGDEFVSLDKVHHWRTKPSILEMKKLKSLKLSLSMCSWTPPSNGQWMPRVSSEYAFKLLPDLKVNIITIIELSGWSQNTPTRVMRPMRRQRTILPFHSIWSAKKHF